jgi:hypothetical protein
VVRFAVLKKVELLCFERLSEETEFLTTVLRLMIRRGEETAEFQLWNREGENKARS